MPKDRPGRKCAAVWRTGSKAGRNCGWYARPDSLYCKRHGTQEGRPLSEDHKAAIDKGRRAYWQRIHALMQTDPQAAAQIRGVPMKGSEEAKKRTRAATATRVAKAAGALVERPNEGDKHVKQARIALDKAQEKLPAVPDRPFEELEPHEQMVVNLGLSLKNLHDILQMPMGVTVKDGREKRFVPDPKMVSLIKDASLRTIASVIKIDTNRMRAAKADRTVDLLQRLRDEVAAGRKEPAVIEGKAAKVG